MTEEKNQKQPPMIGPYFLSVLLFALGLWCVYDGWFTTNPEMYRHEDFNRVMSVVFIGWSIYDFVQTRRMKKSQKEKKGKDQSIQKNDTES
jgi:hypothetical protein